MGFTSIIPESTLGFGFLAAFLYVFIGGVYRLYFSPIAKFPGPKLAALTWWYQFYYDFLLPNHKGQYPFTIQKMHKKYGPIVSVNPVELHIADSSYMDTFYVSNKRDKWFWDLLPALDGSIFATGPSDLHRIRRSAVDPFFSTQNVRKLIRECKETGDVTNARVLFSAYSNDTVMEYTFGQSNKLLDTSDFNPRNIKPNKEGAQTGQMLKHFRWFFTLLSALPKSMLVRNPNTKAIVAQRKMFVEQILETQKSLKTSKHLTIYHEILDSKLPPEEKTPSRLAGEALVVIGAGTETTAWNLTIAFYYLLSLPKILLKLKAELRDAIPDPDGAVPLVTLEHLPYLTGVIKETLRLSQGVTGNIPRISKEDLRYQEWDIPAGTPISMSFLDIHSDETIFPDWKAFKPERWINNPGLGKYYYAFSKGPRHCLGMNLAYAEIYILLRAKNSSGDSFLGIEDTETVTCTD
ncbi:cytochrome P450 [Rhexocercosporidium sp. MPI-PUGE-AT-0058]|nr:cytochrome P450 [Rhexocercosporidium sp. MPI-PUGE-AT-0058]